MADRPAACAASGVPDGTRCELPPKYRGLPEPATDSPRFPEKYMAVAGLTDERSEKDERYRQFCDLREELLVDYCYNTARAYWGDLDDIWRWAEERGKDVLALTDRDLRQYVALMRRRRYSENTVRRRLVAYRLLGTLLP